MLVNSFLTFLLYCVKAFVVNAVKTNKNKAKASLIVIWGGIVGRVRSIFRNIRGYVYIPDLAPCH